jgi:hypothetical protein
MKLGILIHFDPTVKKINSELLFLNELVNMIKPSQVIVIKCMSRAESLFKRYDLDFKYSIESDQTLDDYDAIIAWNSTNMSNFFGGMVSRTFVNYYKFVSYYSNKGTPILYRSGDSENEIFDYQEMVLSRAKTDLAFSTRNSELITDLEQTPQINYNSFYLLVNGERDQFDWVKDTYLVRKPMPLFTDKICEQALYLGDDLFFQVLEKFYQVKDFIPASSIKDSLYWIGFIEHRNSGRKKVFQDLLKDVQSTSVKFTIQTNTEFTLPGVQCVNEGIVGDTIEYFQHLSNYLGYVFIGKGTKSCAYVNKTVYDCFIARLPVLVYTETDQTRMIFPDHPEFYFSNLAELEALYKKLQDLSFREQVISVQGEYIKNRLLAQQDRARLDVLLASARTKTSNNLLEF